MKAKNHYIILTGKKDGSRIYVFPDKVVGVRYGEYDHANTMVDTVDGNAYVVKESVDVVANMVQEAILKWD